MLCVHATCVHATCVHDGRPLCSPDRIPGRLTPLCGGLSVSRRKVRKFEAYYRLLVPFGFFVATLIRACGGKGRIARVI